MLFLFLYVDIETIFFIFFLKKLYYKSIYFYNIIFYFLKIYKDENRDGS